MDRSQQQLQLIIKAANLKNPDYKLECDLNWSVKQLKLYLSDNYPTKPNVKFMRLIYFGKLLDDHLILKDFLRTSNDVTVHNIHIVYKNYNDDLKPSNSDLNTSDTPSTSTANLTTGANVNESPQQQQPDVMPKPTVTFRSQKEKARCQYELIYMKLKEYYERCGVHVHGNSWNSTYLQQTALYYHMHSNYMQSLDVNLTSEQTLPQQFNETSQTVEQPPPQQQQQQQANEQPQVAAQAQPQFQNDLDANRAEEREDDWLSLLHNLCSFLVLFSIIYFYSSFTRFIMVFAVVVLLFLYHSGWFTLERRQVRNENVPAPPQNPLNNNNQPQQPDDQDVNADNSAPQPPPTVPQQPPQPSVIRLMITFFVTFFTSLLPDRAVRVQN